MVAREEHAELVALSDVAGVKCHASAMQVELVSSSKGSHAAVDLIERLLQLN